MRRPPWPVVAAAALLLVAPLVYASMGGSIPGLVVERTSTTALPPPPTLALRSPSDGDGVGPKLLVAGEALSETSVLDVQWRLDGGSWRSVPDLARAPRSAAAFAFEAAVEEGDHVLELRAFDGDAFSLPARATVRSAATPPPTVALLSPRDGDGVGTTVEVAGTVSGRGPFAVALVVDGASFPATVGPIRDGVAAWTATLDLEPGVRTIDAVATGTGDSLPRGIVVAAGDPAPPTLRVLQPAPGAAFGSGGDGACARPCVRFVGDAQGADEVSVALDEGAPATVAVVGGAWTWEIPVAGLFTGEHRATLVPRAGEREGAPREVAFVLRTPRELDVAGDDAPRPTRTPLRFAVAEGFEDVRWRLDGTYVAAGREATIELSRPGDHLLVAEARGADGRLATRAIPLFAINRAPVAAIAASPAGPVVGLVAEASDVDGVVVERRWELGDGARLTTRDAEISHRYAKQGVYRVNLTVVDDRGLASPKASLLVPVLNAAPLAGFSWSPAEPTVRDLVAFVDESADPEGRLATREWSFGDAGSRLAQPAHRFATRGDHLVTLTVADAEGVSATATRVVRVVNAAPHAAIDHAPRDPVAGEEVLFRDASADPDGPIVAWSWDLAGSTSTGHVAARAFDRAGTYRVSLRVVDDAGAAADAFVDVVVRDAPPEVVDVLVSPATPKARDEVRFDLVASDADDDVLRVVWAFGDGATLGCDLRCALADGSSPWTAYHRYARSGLYAAHVTLVDGAGLEATRRFVVAVANAPPTTALRLHSGGEAVFPTTLVAEGADADGGIALHRFDADGDGRWDCVSPEPLCVFVYERPGTYAARVETEDDEGGLAEAGLLVDVVAPPSGLAPPTVLVESPVPGQTLRGEVLLRGVARGVRPIELVEVQLRDGTRTYATGRSAWTPAQGAESWRLLLDARAFPEGELELVVRATDAGGGVGFARVPVVLAGGEAVPDLQVTLEGLADGAIVDGVVLVHGAAHHPEGGITAIRWRLDDGPWRAAEGDARGWRVRLEGLPPGEHLLQVDAYRGLSERAEASVSFSVVGRLPALEVREPPGEVAYGVLRAAGVVEGRSQVLWRLDHGVWRELPLGREWTLEAPTDALPGGLHTLELKAVLLDGSAESPPVQHEVRIVRLHADPPPFPDEPAGPLDEAPAGLLAPAALGAAAALRGFGQPRRRS